MKKELMRSRCNLFFLLLGFLFSNLTLNAQIEKTKTVNETFTIKKGALVKVNHRKGALHVKRSLNDEVNIRMDVLVVGKYEKDVEALLQSTEAGRMTAGNTQLEISTQTNIKNWININGKSTVELQGGKELRGIDEMHVDMVVAIPDGCNLEVSNKYHDITFEKVNANVSIQNYNGNVYAENIDGDFSMNLKYGKAKVGNVKYADILLYESTLNMGNAKELKLNSKYSKNTFGNLGSVNIESYESTFDVGTISENLVVDDKYSDWSVGTIKEGKIKTYESDWNAGTVQNLIIDSKESEFNFGTAESINFEKSYEDDFNVGIIGTFTSENSKHLDVEIGTLKKGLYLRQDYEGDFEIKTVLSSFEGAELDGKNTDLELPLRNIKYQIDAEIRNGDVSLEDDNLKAGFFLEKSNKTTIRGMMNGANEKSPKVILKGTNMDVELD